MPIVTIKPKEPIYKDIDLSFNPHPLTGDIGAKSDADAVKQALRNLFFIEPFDYPFEPDASSIRKILFENNNHLTYANFKDSIKRLIKRKEPRVDVKSVDIEESSTGLLGYYITVIYTINSISTEENFQFFVKKVR